MTAPTDAPKLAAHTHKAVLGRYAVGWRLAGAS
jgi:hypothetical protein